MDISRAAVIGAGVMGSGIAAHIANAGIPVVLLDIVPGAAKAAIARMLKTEPAAFMHKDFAGRVTPGNLDTDLGLIAEADWIVEAVVEKPAVKAELYRQLQKLRKPGSVVSSNTSTIPLAMLVADQEQNFAEDFLITHFFNPPRYMRLLELVGGPHTRPDALAAIADFADRRLGKGVVPCHDTPGFIANRIGTYWIQAAINAALDLGLTVEQADAVCGRPLGIPKTGVFGLLDLVGLDLMPHVSRSLLDTLPEGDGYRAIHREVPLFERMIADGYTGRKGKGGFYRLVKSDDGKRVKQAIDLATGEYRIADKPKLDSIEAARRDLRALVEHPDLGGRFARTVLIATLSYAARLVPEIADDVVAVDRAMQLGYNWKYGPFELIDRLGGAWLAEQLRAAGAPVPALLELAAGRPFYRVDGARLDYLTTDGSYAPVLRPSGVLLLGDVKRGARPLAKNGSAQLWDIGDGVICLEFTSKMNTLDLDTMAMIRTAIETIGDGQGRWKAMVIHNEGDNFSVGANLGMAMFLVNTAMWPQIEATVAEGQNSYLAMRYAPFPVVGAPSGMALGGGCEMLLHCDAVQAHAETYVGLVEVGVGILPAWGGSKELVTRQALKPGRAGGPMPPVTAAFETIATAKVAKSAEEARDLLYLREGDGITMNRDRLLADAKAKVLALARDYRPPAPAALALPGPTGKVLLDLVVENFRAIGKATPHDVVVSDALARVLSGDATDLLDTVSEQTLLALERREFMRLVRTSGTIDRIEHMLTTGKPLRN
ncbi:MAG: 3-hydroxyacyl-CoA dehydrogenase [Azospirillum sp.]|nr:3-hydroxyacyl-CoA dehydrogenase [Azospirillum sp.]